MPCDQTITIEQNFSVANLELLEQAVESMGWQVRTIYSSREGLSFYDQSYNLYRLKGGVLETATSEGNSQAPLAVAKQLRKAYAQKAVELAAKRFNWQLKPVSQGKLSLMRRR